jgi:hypothetical protein
MTGKRESGLGLHPGSRMPGDSEEVDALLRLVPDIAFAPELDACVFAPEALAGTSLFSSPEQIGRLADDEYLGTVRSALERLQARGQREKNGGLEFLARTLEHFLDQMSPAEHPLIVALWCRSWARRRGRDEVPAAIAMAMDDYESSRGSRG